MPTKIRDHTLWSSAVCLLLSLVTFSAMYLFFVRTSLGQRVDAVAYVGGQSGRWAFEGIADRVLSVISTITLIGVCLFIVVLGALRRRFSVVAAGLTVLAGANLSTQILKQYVLARPELGVTGMSGNSLPSGHATVAATIVCALLLTVAPAARAVIAPIGAIYVAATAASAVMLGWHRLSDVLTAMVVTGAWVSAVLLAAAWYRAVSRRKLAAGPHRQERSTFFLTVRAVLLCITGIAIVAALSMFVVLLVKAPREGYLLRLSDLDPAIRRLGMLLDLTGIAAGALALVCVPLILLPAAVTRR